MQTFCGRLNCKQSKCIHNRKNLEHSQSWVEYRIGKITEIVSNCLDKNELKMITNKNKWKELGIEEV